MKNQKENETDVIFKEKEWYKKKIVEMIYQINDEKFLNQIRIILKRHIEKRGC